jgi:hypothetical protein
MSSIGTKLQLGRAGDMPVRRGGLSNERPCRGPDSDRESRKGS